MPIIKQYTKLISIFEFVSVNFHNYFDDSIFFSRAERNKGTTSGEKKGKVREFLGKQGMHVFEKQERRCYRRFQLIHQIAKNIFNQRVPAGERAEQKIPRSVRG